MADTSSTISSDRQSFDPSPEQMRATGYKLIDALVDHLASLRDQPVARRGSREDFQALVDEPLPTSPGDIPESLDFFFRNVVPSMTFINHPRFHAFIPGPSSFAGAAGAMLAAGTNPFVGTWLGGATVSALELTVIRWIAEMLDYDPTAAGLFTSGGSMANLTALAAARARGTSRSGPPVIYVSAEGHASVTGAAAVLGFDRDAIRTVATDDGYRMDVDALRTLIEDDLRCGRNPLCLVANGGTTNLGVVDPLPELAQVCREYGLWYHVDAAYGGFAAMTDPGKQLLAGMQEADSLTLDPHKWLYCPMGIGCVLIRHQEALKAAFATHGDYLKDLPDDEVNFFEYGPELSRPARVLPVWMVIRSVGRDMLARQIEDDLRLAQLAADLLEADERLEVVRPTLSVVGFRHRARSGETEAQRAARDTQLMEQTLASGELMLSTTLVNGQSTLRMVVMNHQTTEADIFHSVSRIRLFAV